MNNNQMNSKLEQSFKDPSQNVNEFLTSEKLHLLDVLKMEFLKEKIAVAYAHFYGQYLSESNGNVFEEITNPKQNLKTCFF